MTSSAEARPIVVEALKRVLGRAPLLGEIYILQAVARYDGGYGNFTSPPHGPEGPKSNNWGAVQHPDLMKFIIWRGVTNPSRTAPEVKEILSMPAPSSPKPEQWFYASDYQSPKHGGKGWFWGPYRVYTDAAEGAAHVATILKRMKVFELVSGGKTPSWNDVAREMFNHSYFKGYGDDEAAIRAYAENLADGGRTFVRLFHEASPIIDPKVQSAAVGSPVVYSLPPASLPLLVTGSHGEAVELWQRIIGIPVTGKFDHLTTEVTKDWQRSRGLVGDDVDGKVGKQTWGLVLC